MTEGGEPFLQEADLADLACLIRLTSEFFYYLQRADAASPDAEAIRYACDSIFSGVDCFILLFAACEIMPGGLPASTLAWDSILPGKLTHQFNSAYREYLAEPEFARRCRLLLDLFKLQIVFAGMSYG
jgi:hypothetical protein